jgi:hypothetical protein
MTSIDDVHAYVLRGPLERPIADAIYRRTHWHTPVAKLRASDGLVGTGISGVWAGEYLARGLEAYREPVTVSEERVSLPDARWASTAIHPDARAKWGAHR